MFDLSGKVALVTGGSRGIGAAVVEALAGAGALVAINYRNRRDAAEAVLARVEGAGGRAELVGFDVADSGAAADAIERAVSTVLDRGLRTADIESPGTELVSTEVMGDAVVAALEAR